MINTKKHVPDRLVKRSDSFDYTLAQAGTSPSSPPGPPARNIFKHEGHDNFQFTIESAHKEYTFSCSPWRIVYDVYTFSDARSDGRTDIRTGGRTKGRTNGFRAKFGTKAKKESETSLVKVKYAFIRFSLKAPGGKLSSPMTCIGSIL